MCEEKKKEEGLPTFKIALMQRYNDSWGCPCGVIVKVMGCGIVANGFEFQLHYYVHTQPNTHGKGMNPLILHATV